MSGSQYFAWFWIFCQTGAQIFGGRLAQLWHASALTLKSSTQPQQVSFLKLNALFMKWIHELCDLAVDELSGLIQQCHGITHEFSGFFFFLFLADPSFSQSALGKNDVNDFPTAFKSLFTVQVMLGCEDPWIFLTSSCCLNTQWLGQKIQWWFKLVVSAL